MASTDLNSWVERMTSDDDIVRIEAVESPPNHASGVVVKQLIAALEDPSNLVRLLAAEQLGYCPADQVRVRLRAFVQDESDHLARSYALSSLGLVGELEVVQALIVRIS